ncbi:MAG TPA: BTAD domain-containing putative transcriptional regulator [Acidimicrobiales bacterium]
MTELRYHILGPLEVRADGEAMAVRSPRQRLILAVLLVHANRYVGPDQLIDACWGDDLPADPDAALRTQISRLRRTLADCGEPLDSQGSGYVLRVPDGALDAERFSQLLANARGVAGPDPRTALATVDEALALWRGRAFADVPECEPLAAEARRLDELRVAAREERAAILLAAGRAEEAVADLRALADADPVRDRTTGLLMEALYHAGRQAEALAAYQEHRQRLADELGIEPSTALADLERRILTHDLVASRALAAPAVAPPPRPRTWDIPVPVSSFVGRGGDMAALTALLARARLVTLVGPGGVGKTRLAQQVAADLVTSHADGAWFCELSEEVTREGVARRVASTLRLDDRADLGPGERVIEVLRTKRALLVLDNCEQAIDAVADLVDRLLSGTRAVTVLATSRERLAVQGEHLWQVAPLALPPDPDPDAPALRLFADRAAAVRPGFAVTAGERRLVAEICRRLDGLPLAVELAAAQMRAMSLDEIAAGLGERFRLAASGVRTNPRHRSLDAAIDWSYRLLEPDAQAVFSAVAVFATGFSMEGARAVAADDGLTGDDVARAVVDLLDRSLLVERDPGTGPTTRYGMLETIRRFARRRLEESGRGHLVRARHATYLLDVAERAAVGVRGGDEATWVEVVSRERDELQAAHRWLLGDEGGLDRAVRLSAALYWYALWRADSVVLSWAAETVERARGCDHPLLPLVHAAAAVGAWQRGDLAAADELVDRGLEAAGPSSQGAVQLWECRGDVALFRGDLDTAVASYAEALARARAEADDLEVVVNLVSEALTRFYQGDVETAAERSEQALDIAVPTGSPSATAMAYYAAGEMRLDAEPEAARRLLDRSLELAEQVDARFVFGIAGLSAATMHARAGSVPRALDLYERLVDHWLRAGVWTQQWTTLRTLVELLADLGEDRAGAALLGAIDATATAAPAFGADARRLDEVSARLRASLGEVAFAAALHRGAGLGDEGAVALAAHTLRRLRARG